MRIYSFRRVANNNLTDLPISKLNIHIYLSKNKLACLVRKWCSPDEAPKVSSTPNLSSNPASYVEAPKLSNPTPLSLNSSNEPFYACACGSPEDLHPYSRPLSVSLNPSLNPSPDLLDDLNGASTNPPNVSSNESPFNASYGSPCPPLDNPAGSNSSDWKLLVTAVIMMATCFWIMHNKRKEELNTKLKNENIQTNLKQQIENQRKEELETKLKNENIQTILKEQIENQREEIRRIERDFAILSKKSTELEKIKETLLLSRQLRLIPLGKMKIMRVLGQGCNGIVFLVEIQLEKGPVQVALKMILNFQQLSTISLAGEYQNEFRILFTFTDVHPNIVHILKDFQGQPSVEMINCVHKSVQDLLTRTSHNGVRLPITTQFFVIEYHPIDLEQLLKSRKVEEKEIYQFAGELFSCFKFLFHNKVVHRDVKLANILVSASESLIVSDFGESLLADDNYCCKVSSLRSGTLQSQAPEVLNQMIESEINFSGQYSWEVGCLLFQIVFRRFPFENYPLGYGIAPHIAVPDLVIENSGLDPRFDQLM